MLIKQAMLTNTFKQLELSANARYIKSGKSFSHPSYFLSHHTLIIKARALELSW